MENTKVHLYNVFSKVIGKGNPAGVVLESNSLTNSDMQKIAFEVGLNETAFVSESTSADFRVRFFTPKQEVDLCAHATIAAINALKMNGFIDNISNLTLETNSGILPIMVDSYNSNISVTMQQAEPKFKKFTGSIKKLAHSIGISINDIDLSLPILYGSTGVWTLLIPIKSLHTFEKMVPKNEQFKKILKEIPFSSVHPFCLDTVDSNANMHGRHFSSSDSGTVEDSVTGTASGVMGAYYAKIIKKDNFGETLNIIVEQGLEINKEGQVLVKVSKFTDEYVIHVSGEAVHFDDLNIQLDRLSS